MSPKRVLVIDDDPDVHDLVEVGLAYQGWQTLHAMTAPEGVTLAEAERPDAILLDVMLPVTDGPTIFRQLQANPVTCDIPIVFLTASYPGRLAHDGLQEVPTLAKPFRPATLAQRVVQLLGWSQDP